MKNSEEQETIALLPLENDDKRFKVLYKGTLMNGLMIVKLSPQLRPKKWATAISRTIENEELKTTGVYAESLSQCIEELKKLINGKNNEI